MGRTWTIIGASAVLAGVVFAATAVLSTILTQFPSSFWLILETTLVVLLTAGAGLGAAHLVRLRHQKALRELAAQVNALRSKASPRPLSSSPELALLVGPLEGLVGSYRQLLDELVQAREQFANL